MKKNMIENINKFLENSSLKEKLCYLDFIYKN